VNERDIQFPNLESFLDWINIQININSVVELGVNVTLKTSIVKEENKIKIMVIATERDNLKISTSNQFESNNQKRSNEEYSMQNMPFRSTRTNPLWRIHQSKCEKKVGNS
jgi:hypothetical protein